MTKIEFARKIAQANDITVKAATECIEMFTNGVRDALVEGEDVTLVGFGKFATKVQPGREGVLAFGEHKGETWKSEDKTVPYFKAGTSLKEAVM